MQWKAPFLALSLVLLLAPRVARGQTAGEADRRPKDRSAQFNANLKGHAAADVSNVASEVVFVLVPGLGANLFKKGPAKTLDPTKRPWFNMRPNYDALKSMGFDVRTAPINTEQPIAVAGQAIRSYAIGLAHETHKPVVFLSYSDGSAGVGSALAEGKKEELDELHKVTAGHIAMNANYGGTPLAKLVLKFPLKPLVKQLIVRWGHGSMDMVRNIRPEDRHEWMTAHPYPTGKVYTLSYITSAKRPPLNPMVAPWAAMRFGAKANSDGMVTTEAQHIPGTDFVMAVGQRDHARVAGLTGHIRDAQRTTKALVATFFAGRPAPGDHAATASSSASASGATQKIAPSR